MKVTEEGTTNIIKWYQPESAEECKSTDCMKCVYYSYIPSSSSCPFEAWMINHPVEKSTDIDEQLKAIQNEMKRGLILGTPDEYKKAVQQMAEACTTHIKRDNRASMIQKASKPAHKPKLLRKVDCIPEDSDKSSDVLQDQHSAQDILNMCVSLQANTMQMQVEPLQDMVNVLDLIIEVTEKQDELTEIRQEQPATEEKQDPVQQVQARRYQKYIIERCVIRSDEIKHENIYIPSNAVLKRHIVIDQGSRNFEKDLVHVVTWLKPIE